MAEVLLRDNLGNPVANASDTANFAGTFNEPRSGPTDVTGLARLLTAGTAKGHTSISACVDSVSGTSLAYLPNGTGCTP